MWLLENLKLRAWLTVTSLVGTFLEQQQHPEACEKDSSAPRQAQAIKPCGVAQEAELHCPGDSGASLGSLALKPLSLSAFLGHQLFYRKHL